MGLSICTVLKIPSFLKKKKKKRKKSFPILSKETKRKMPLYSKKPFWQRK